ncbi:NAD(P)-dependent oxidoreductase [Amycolatopsis sp.]|uniref:NAD(P)-dependent oxidoreductase n=1 Tax=Amycolatopsis sp. TaxID=37632 RepID=UPI002C668F2C|nr:NAD(P)H-binding protein [Amycolatopsis sp.]HVV09218.1 NAD(P)H-binding protein [Amycolatopsis sp.]
MKLTVFGATGGTGTEVVRQGLAAGHEITAVVRDPARLPVSAHERLKVMVADVFDPAAIAPAITGRHAVISALGPRGRGPTTVCRDGVRSIMSAMETVGVQRLLVVSNSGMHTEGDGFFTGKIIKPVLIRILRDGYADMREMERQVLTSRLQWTVVRPPRLTNWPHSGEIASNVAGNVRGSFNLGRADLADFLLRATGDDRLIRTAVSVAKG